jgi:Tfp pilus assembly protein PilX
MLLSRATLRQDDGIAMPLVMGVIAVLTVLSVASFALASNALNETRRTQGETVAFQIANAGVDAALEQVYRNGFQSGNYPAAANISGGSYTVEMEQLDNSEYELRSVGTDATGFSETVVVRFFYINLWEMIFAAGNQESLTAGGGGINGNSNVTGPFYVRGSVEMSGASYVHKGPLFVDGTLTRQGNAELGSSALPIRLYVSGAYPEPSAKAFYSSVSQSVPRIDLPRFSDDELLEAAQKAQAESVDNAMGTPAWTAGTNYETVDGDNLPSHYTTVNPPNAGAFTRRYARNDDPTLHQFGYKYIGAASEPSAAGQGTTGLTINSTSFGAWYGNGYTTPGMHDDFAYDAVNRVLYVYGTVFIDGPLTIGASNGQAIRYVGNGTLVVNGPITINVDIHPYNTGANEVARRKMDAGHVLGIATPTDMSISGTNSNSRPGDPPEHSMALYAGGSIRFHNNELYIGSIVAGHINMGVNNVHMVTDPDLPDFLPDSLPGRDAPILTKGAWARQ